MSVPTVRLDEAALGALEDRPVRALIINTPGSEVEVRADRTVGDMPYSIPSRRDKDASADSLLIRLITGKLYISYSVESPRNISTLNTHFITLHKFFARVSRALNLSLCKKTGRERKRCR